MVASKHSIVSSKFYKVSQAAKYLGVSQSQIRLLMKSGEIRGVRTLGGHRLVEIASLLEYCGEESVDDSDKGIPIALVARVSTAKQSKGFSKESGESSDLQRQRDRIRDYITAKWGEKANVREFCRTSSGMNYACPIFLSLVHAILAGEFDGGFVVCEHEDRILRFGNRLLAEICSFHNVEIVTIGEDVDNKTEDESIADSVLSIICHFTAKKYGARASETCSKNLSEPAIKRIQELKAANMDGKAIHKTIVSEGYLNSHGEKPSYGTVLKYLAKDFELAAKVEGKAEGETGFELFNQFVNQNCVLGQSYRIKNRDLINAYSKFCQKNNKALPQAATIGQYISKMNLKRSKSNGNRVTLGISLK